MIIIVCISALAGAICYKFVERLIEQDRKEKELNKREEELKERENLLKVHESRLGLIQTSLAVRNMIMTMFYQCEKFHRDLYQGKPRP